MRRYATKQDQLNGLKVAILATDGFEQLELLEPRRALNEAGAMTSWPSLKSDLKNAGAEWVDEEVVVDKNLITSRKPDDIPALDREMLKVFADAQAH